MKNISVDLKVIKILENNKNIRNENCTEIAEKVTTMTENFEGPNFWA